MNTVSSEDVKVVMFSWLTSETVGAAALWRKGMILYKVSCVARFSHEVVTHLDAFLGPLYRMILSLPRRRRMAGKDTASYSAQRSTSTSQSILSRRWAVFEVAESHSVSRALLATLKFAG